MELWMRIGLTAILLAILSNVLLKRWIRRKYRISSIPIMYYRETARIVAPLLSRFQNISFPAETLRGWEAGYLIYVQGIALCDGIRVNFSARWTDKKNTYLNVGGVTCYFDEVGENEYLDRKVGRK